MAQHDYNIANASFPTVRTDINNVLSAINSTNSGSSRPISAVAGTIWLDTTSATTPTLKFFDGTDDISLGVLDYSANTITYTLADGSITTAKILDDNITTAKILDSNVTTAKIADANITLAKLSATGTKDSTTFLRGDNTFAAAGGGKVLQVVTATDNVQRTTTSTSYVTGSNALTVSITPSSTSNKIMIIGHTTTHNVTTAKGVYLTVYKDGSNIVTSQGLSYYYSTSGYDYSSISFTFLDSPSSTSSLTYQVYFKADSSSTGSINSNTTTGSITVMEISE